MAPLSQPLPPNLPKAGDSRGEERNLGGTMTQGGALGYLLTPLQGSQDEAAAPLPLHFFKRPIFWIPPRLSQLTSHHGDVLSPE